MSSSKNTFLQEDMSSPKPKKDFAYYVPLMKQATELYDLAVENDVDDQENELLRENKRALDKCRDVCEALLANDDLPLENNILLNWYLCAHQQDHIRDFYLNQALVAVGLLEALEAQDGKIKPDPMREILESELRSIKEKAYATRTPVSFVDGAQNVSPMKSFVPSTQHAPYMQHSSRVQHGLQMYHGTQMQSYDPSTQQAPYMQHGLQMHQNSPQIQPVAHTQHGSQMQFFARSQNRPPTQQVPHMQSFGPLQDSSYMQPVWHGPQMHHGSQMHHNSQRAHSPQIQRSFQMEGIPPMQGMGPVQPVTPLQNGWQMQHSGSQMQHGFQRPHSAPILPTGHLQPIRQMPLIAHMPSVASTRHELGNESFGNASQDFFMTAADQMPTPTVIVSTPSLEDEEREMRRRSVAFIQEATARRVREMELREGNMEREMDP